jgi:zona occludens toxin (predicted ATPase)
MKKLLISALLIMLLIAFGAAAYAQDATAEPTEDAPAAVVTAEPTVEATEAAAQPEATAEVSPTPAIASQPAAQAPTDNTPIIIAIVVSGIVAAIGAYFGFSRGSKS